MSFCNCEQSKCRLKQTLETGGEPAVDPYAAEAPEEFFAVMSEAFFEIPKQLQSDYPGIYRQLQKFYRQDPAARFIY